MKKATTTLKEEEEQLEARKGRRLSLSADRCGDQGAERLAGRDARSGPKSHADPEVVEEWKWRGIPVWEHAGIICTGETYKNVVKMTFAGPLSGRVETGRPPGKRPDSKI